VLSISVRAAGRFQYATGADAEKPKSPKSMKHVGDDAEIGIRPTQLDHQNVGARDSQATALCHWETKRRDDS
jgi:hypothetical protein